MSDKVEVHAVESETDKIVEVELDRAVVDVAFPTVFATVSEAEEKADRSKFEREAVDLVRRWYDYERCRIAKSQPRPVTSYQQNKLSHLASCLTDTLAYNIPRIKPMHPLNPRSASL